MTTKRVGHSPQDFGAGLVVFLVALPLCLGIALASDAPLQAGLITGIVAGIVVGLLSGSEVSVSGPAAGLTVIVAGAIAKLGSFETFTAAVVLSGVFQIIFGKLKAGGLSGLFPNAVIKGMLAAIGLTIILKQIPHALGRDKDFEGDLGFWMPGGESNTFTEIISSIAGIQWNIAAITAIGLIIMFGWPKVQEKLPKLKLLPAALLAVLSAIGVSELFAAWGMGISADHMVQIPKMDGIAGFFGGFRLPTVEALTSSDVWVVAFTLALVGSVETLLCIEATDKLDPHGRISNTDRELYAQGTGNVLAGLLGGLPMTSVIVRSSANIYAGATSRFSAVYHGILLLFSVLFLASLLNKIPLSALAAILFFVGYKLTPVQLYKEAKAKGKEYFVSFLVTIGAILFTDLLTGVGIGFAVGILFVIKSNHYGAIDLVNDGDDYLIKFTKDVSFPNKITLRKMIREIPKGSRVVVDGTQAMFIDRDIYDILNEFEQSAPKDQIEVSFVAIQGKRYSLVKNKKRSVESHGVPQTNAVKQRRLG